MRDALLASGREVVTVALRRVDLDRAGDGDVLDFVPPAMTCCPTPRAPSTPTRRSGWPGWAAPAPAATWSSSRSRPTRARSRPDPIETLRAAERLVARASSCCRTARPTPVLCRHLEEAGCATVMPLGAWIGSNRGLRTRDAIEVIVEQAHVPVVVDAGLGVPSDAAEAMEVGADAVLVNTAIAVAADPGADGPRLRARHRGRSAGPPRRAGSRRDQAEASSPLTGF
jgi:thiazole synthase